MGFELQLMLFSGKPLERSNGTEASKSVGYDSAAL
jgi:hypothetical protein